MSGALLHYVNGRRWRIRMCLNGKSPWVLTKRRKEERRGAKSGGNRIRSAEAHSAKVAIFSGSTASDLRKCCPGNTSLR